MTSGTDVSELESRVQWLEHTATSHETTIDRLRSENVRQQLEIDGLLQRDAERGDLSLGLRALGNQLNLDFDAQETDNG